jgi:hypothetical protein
MQRHVRTTQEQEKWCKTPLASAIEKENKLDEGSSCQSSSRRQDGSHYRSTPGSGEGEGDVDQTPRLPVGIALNDLPFAIQYTDGQQRDFKGQSVADLQILVDAATGNVPDRAYRRKKRFRTRPNPPDKPLLTEEEAAYVLDLEPESLAVFRSTGRHQIPFIKIGRNVRYRRSDLEAWLISRTHTTGVTSEKCRFENSSSVLANSNRRGRP